MFFLQNLINWENTVLFLKTIFPNAIPREIIFQLELTLSPIGGDAILFIYENNVFTVT